ncbi:O-methyltransferase [Spirosoma pomorum]
MAHQTLQLTNDLVDYMRQKLIREPEVLKDLRVSTQHMENSDRQISPEQAQFMSFLIETINAQNILEIGTLRGYSALAAALVIPDSGKIITCDINQDYCDVAVEAWQKAGVSHKIDLRIAPAIDTLTDLTKKKFFDHFDLVFIDADKENHVTYYELVLPLVRKGGVIVIDNIFWEGAVADPSQSDIEVDGIRKLNDLLHLDERVTTSIIPIGDGVMLAKKR